MRKIYTMFVSALFVISLSAISASAIEQNVQVFTTDNTNGNITPKTISAAFASSGLSIGGNNDMNKPFKLRFTKLHYKTYNLAMFRSDELTLKLIKKYPKFGVLTPLTMSIYSDKGSMNISTLTLEGMARTTGIPVTDPDLIAYAKLTDKALHLALPNGKYKKLSHNVESKTDNYAQAFSVELEKGTDLEEWREDFENEFEGEMEPIGFLMPNYTNLVEEIFEAAKYEEYDFFITYSVCKFDVIYPVSKLHPEAGAYAPCTMYVYKKKGDSKVYIGYLGVNNWIKTLDIKDEKAVAALNEAQGMINNILAELTE
ncbi:MAG: hypothetical protein ACI9RG_000492 [Sulfurimonas sp.]|jgi:uncharacterized protein (DUF302 family)